jgi:hypothetical protein
MLSYALMFLVVRLVSAALGLSGGAGIVPPEFLELVCHRNRAVADSLVAGAHAPVT